MKQALISFILLLSCSLISTLVYATEIRGRIDTRNPYSGYYQPLPRAEVALVNPVNGQPFAVTYTGMDGFYYFYGVNPGNYVLVINRMRNIPITIPPTPGYDIPPVLF